MGAAAHPQMVHPQTELRSPDTVMKLERMGSFFPTRLSFMRTMIRQLAAESVVLKRPVWKIDDEGFGRAVYSLVLGGHDYSLIAFSTKIPPEMRTDRVIAEVWDTSYVLFDGVPDDADLQRIEVNAPRQEAGRFLASELILSRANKSVRLFDHVVERLAGGKQPDEEMIASIGYLMRTTAVYGNGKFGIADRARFAYRPGLAGPFQAEMLTVWLIRNFTHDLVEHVAFRRAPETAVKLEPRLKRHLGIGNSTGLGMAPFLVNHPILLNNWMQVRETALARVCAIEIPTSDSIARIGQLAKRVGRHLDQWNVPDARQMERINTLRQEWPWIVELVSHQRLEKSYPWKNLMQALSKYSVECQELVVGLLLEPHGDIVDGLTDCMASDLEPWLEPAMTLGKLRKAIDEHYEWARSIDLAHPSSKMRFWYVSEEKLEPRIGNRFEEEGAQLEMPHDIAEKLHALTIDLNGASDKKTVAEFLLANPSHRFIVKRIQTTARFEYAEIRDNLVGEKCLPIDMLRCKLSFFGASKFDPKSDRWTRITLYQGAPLAEEIANPLFDHDDWWLPVLSKD